MSKIFAIASLFTLAAASIDCGNNRRLVISKGEHNRRDPRKYFDIEETMVFAMNKQEAKKKHSKGLTR